MKRYDWIIFDSTGTLMTPDPDAACTYQVVAERFGSRRTVDQIRADLKSAIARHFFGDTVSQSTDEEIERNRWRKIVAETLTDVKGKDLAVAFESLWNHFASAQAWRIYDDVLDSIDRLRIRGYSVAVASNFDARLRRILHEMGVQDRFDEIFISSELGWSKPNTQFYHAAASRLCADDPSNLLMIGDTHQGDVLAARKAGWDARHLIRNQDLALSALTRDL